MVRGRVEPRGVEEISDCIVNVDRIKDEVIVSIFDGRHVKRVATAIKVLLDELFVVLLFEEFSAFTGNIRKEGVPLSSLRRVDGVSDVVLLSI